MHFNRVSYKQKWQVNNNKSPIISQKHSNQGINNLLTTSCGWLRFVQCSRSGLFPYLLTPSSLTSPKNLWIQMIAFAVWDEEKEGDNGLPASRIRMLCEDRLNLVDRVCDAYKIVPFIRDRNRAPQIDFCSKQKCSVELTAAWLPI